MALATERWSERTMARGQSAHRGFDVTDVTTMNAAINAVTAQFGVGELASHPEDGRLIVPNGAMSAATDQGPMIWHVQANYTTVGPLSLSPLDEPADIIPDFGVSNEPIDRDNYGNAIANSTRVAFQGVTDDYTDISIIIERWESTFDMAKVIAFTSPKPKLNSDTISIARIGTFQPGQLKCKCIRVGKPLKSDPTKDPYVRMIYHLEARGYYSMVDNAAPSNVSGFCKRILDQGRQGFWSDGGIIRTGKIVQIRTDDTGTEISEEVSEDIRLDGGGFPITEQGQGQWYWVNSSTSAGVSVPLPNTIAVEHTPMGTFLYYLVNESIAFAGLTLPP